MANLKSRKYISIPESKYLSTKTASEVFFLMIEKSTFKDKPELRQFMTPKADLQKIQWSTLYTEEEEGQSQSQQHKSKTHKNVTNKGINPLCST